MDKAFTVLAMSAFLLTGSLSAHASTVNVESFETQTDTGEITENDRETLREYLVDRSPAVLGPPIYEDEMTEAERAAMISDTIPERLQAR